MLYHNACEHCRTNFPRNGVTDVAALLESSPAAQPLGPIMKLSPSSGSSDSPRSRSFTESLWSCILKISVLGLLSSQHGHDISAAEAHGDCGMPTDLSSASVSLWYCILKSSLWRFFFSGRGQTTSHVTAPEIRSSPGDASHHGVSTEFETFTGPSNVSPFPPEDEYVHFTTEFHDRTVTKLMLENVWKHGVWTSLTSIKFSPDGKSLAVGLIDCTGLAQKSYIYDMTSWGDSIWLINLSDLSTLLIGFVVLGLVTLAIGNTTAIHVQTMYLSLLMEDISPWGTCMEGQR